MVLMTTPKRGFMLLAAERNSSLLIIPPYCTVAVEAYNSNLPTQYGKKNPATFSEEQSQERGATQPYRHERRPKHRRKPEVEMGRARGKDGPQTMDAQTDIVGSQDRQKKYGTPDD
ncbi:hypothetical protein ANN_02473 [Periplaneta americana]|uniref:Uncharacterized protein n=1 Tax=Periplaneta americana TaxID=6978 RepID=A0ABQ8TZC0_PERAM|nr:hypothetical protein ANN_02473 [Periplaneta americana]